MPDPYEYLDLPNILRKQLPRTLQDRLSIAVMPDVFGEPPVAIFTASDGRSEQFSVQEDGRITEEQVAHPCVIF